jgi:hypothetical protein
MQCRIEKCQDDNIEENKGQYKLRKCLDLKSIMQQETEENQTMRGVIIFTPQSAVFV